MPEFFSNRGVLEVVIVGVEKSGEEVVKDRASSVIYNSPAFPDQAFIRSGKGKRQYMIEVDPCTIIAGWRVMAEGPDNGVDAGRAQIEGFRLIFA